MYSSKHHFLPPAIPLKQPQIDCNLEYLPALERSAETLRYFMNHLEYTVSPHGRLRQWIKINLLLFLWLSIPIGLFLPLVRYGFREIATISEYLHICSSNLIQSFPLIAVVVIVLSLIVMVFKK